ncbi:MAG: GH1 family beta-glucosidase [Actinomycetota bacterium]|nr:GH1 family beta-glucosidase [Actinomycetota bacterium]
MKRAIFPKGFLWGVATSAYQVEGAVAADGRGQSIWDRFSHAPGMVGGGGTGDVACDQYHRYREDIDLMRQLGVSAYRFSVAWPRIFPDATSKVNQAGLDHYRRLADALGEAGIDPFPTLYHWDMPEWVHARGGWLSRDILGPFRDYVDAVAGALGDRIRYWSVLNEPQVFTTLGYLEGSHAPGIRDRASWLRATHVVNLAQAMGIRSLQASQGDRAAVGTVVNQEPAYPASDGPADIAAAERYHALTNAWFLDPMLHGSYPRAFIDQDEQLELMDVRTSDLDALQARPDFIGLNHYFRVIVEATDDTPEGTRLVPGPGPTTDYGWEVRPGGMNRMLFRVQRDYPGIPLYITENGCSYATEPGPDGRIHDAERIAYLDGYIGQVGRALSEGVDVRGYFLWSLIDNFEWQAGYAQRFGIVHCDFASGVTRTIKDSGYWYRDLIRAGEIEYDEAAD